MTVRSPMPRPRPRRPTPACGATTAGKAQCDCDRGAPTRLNRRESMKPREMIAMHFARLDDGDLDKNHTVASKRSGAVLSTPSYRTIGHLAAEKNQCWWFVVADRRCMILLKMLTKHTCHSADKPRLLFLDDCKAIPKRYCSNQASCAIPSRAIYTTSVCRLRISPSVYPQSPPPCDSNCGSRVRLIIAGFAA